MNHNNYINKLVRMKKKDILNNHDKIKDKTCININSNNEEHCGTIANAIFNYLKEDDKIRYHDSILEVILNIFNDASNNKLIYLIGMQEESGINAEFNHAFCLIKFNAIKYGIIQGYYKEYKLCESPNKVKIFYNKKDLMKILLQLAIFIEKGEYDKSFVEMWKKLTNVDLGIDNKKINRMICVAIYSVKAKSKL